MDLAPVDYAPAARARLRNGLSALVPRTHARSVPQLRAAYPDLSPDELAQRLVADASRDSAVVGTAAACCALAPLPGAAPLAAAGESAAASAVRTRLTAELYTVYGLLDPSPVNKGTTGHLAQWAARDPGGVAASLAALPALAIAVTRTLPGKARSHLHLPRLRTMFAVTAATAGLRSGRATRRYGEALRRDLRKDPTARSQW